MQISPKGLALVKACEGCNLSAYNDAAGLPTIGYGHRIRPGEALTHLTEAGADALLRADLAEAEAAVNRMVTVTLTQWQFDALVCFTFNVGAASLACSTLLVDLNRADYGGAAEEFLRWTKVTDPVTGQKRDSRGLTKRRVLEKRLFEGRDV